VPFDPERLRRVRELKKLKQTDLAKGVGATQTRISECEKDGLPSLELLEKFANALDCTTDFLLGRVFVGESADALGSVVSQLAFDVFAARLSTSKTQRDRCRRVLSHRAAPLTADGWAVLAEQIELAVGPPSDASGFRVVGER
jgi:transcriptional regulator with XRE-family HTH domain